jgi:hypothetical protein
MVIVADNDSDDVDDSNDNDDDDYDDSYDNDDH